MRGYDRGERGNALFLILIAVALFAALSYAVTQSGRGGGTVDKETAMITAGQITQYPAGLRTAVTRMIITGTPATSVDFDVTIAGGDLTSSVKVFGPAGGAAVNEPSPITTVSQGGLAGATAGAWGYKSLLPASDGYYVAGVGTDTDVTGRDAFAYLHDIPLTTCQQIQNGLGSSAVTTPPTQDTAAVDYTTNGGDGDAQGGADPIAAGAANAWFGADITGVAFNCVLNDTTYDYYHALIEQ